LYAHTFVVDSAVRSNSWLVASRLQDCVPPLILIIISAGLCAGNKNGLLMPNGTTDQELMHVRNSLPDAVVVQRCDERLSALGNCIACNDYVALIHPDLDRVRPRWCAVKPHVKPRLKVLVLL
jgi:hypothetical protein